MSLYADEIFVADPFIHPSWTIEDSGNPITNPEHYILSTYQSVYFLLRLEQWIRAGIVTPLLNPTNYDQKYRHQVFSSMEGFARSEASKSEIIDDMRNSHFDAAYFDELFALVPNSELSIAIADMFPSMPKSLAVDFRELLLDSRNSRLDIPDPSTLSGLESQMMIRRGGFDPATAALIASKLNAFPISETKTNLRLLNSLFEQPNQLAETWTPLAGAFRETTLDFLDDVEPDFAISLRKDGRLHGFRQMLRGIWGNVTNASDLTPHHIDVVRLSDQLRSEHEKAKAEWTEIRAKAARWGVLTATTILAGTLALNVPSYLAAGGLLVDAYQHWKSRKAFKIKNPASVLIDLQKRSRFR